MNKQEVLTKYLSTPRLAPYFKACGGHVEKGLELYQLNMRLGASFLPLLSVLEVALRNGIDEKLSRYFNNNDWWQDLEQLFKRENQKEVSSLEKKYGERPQRYSSNTPLNKMARTMAKHKRKLEDDEKNKIRTEVMINLRKSHSFNKLEAFQQQERINKMLNTKISQISIAHSQLIASATFGFWTSMVKSDIHKATKGTLIKVFPNRHKEIKIRHISLMLDKVRKFRNRIAHNEPICFKQGHFNIDNARQVHKHIKEILCMMDSNLDEFCQETYLIHQHINSVEMFFEELPTFITS